MSHILRTNLRRIKRVNEAGVQKLIRNVQSLQQNLTNLLSVKDKKELETVVQYYELFLLSGSVCFFARARLI